MSAANERRVITRRSQSEVSIDKEQPIRGEHYLSGEKTVRMKRRESEALTTCHWSLKSSPWRSRSRSPRPLVAIKLGVPQKVEVVSPGLIPSLHIQ